MPSKPCKPCHWLCGGLPKPTLPGSTCQQQPEVVKWSLAWPVLSQRCPGATAGATRCKGLVRAKHAQVQRTQSQELQTLRRGTSMMRRWVQIRSQPIMHAVSICSVSRVNQQPAASAQHHDESTISPRTRVNWHDCTRAKSITVDISLDSSNCHPCIAAMVPEHHCLQTDFRPGGIVKIAAGESQRPAGVNLRRRGWSTGSV